MPSASDELRDIMQRWFGDEVDCRGPIKFLASHGFKELRGIIIPPVPSHTLSEEECICIKFLVDEWDFGYARHGRMP